MTVGIEDLMYARHWAQCFISTDSFNYINITFFEIRKYKIKQGK